MHVSNIRCDRNFREGVLPNQALSTTWLSCWRTISLSQPWNPISIQHPSDNNPGQDFPWSKSYGVMHDVDAVQAQQHFLTSALQPQMETLIRPHLTKVAHTRIIMAP